MKTNLIKWSILIIAVVTVLFIIYKFYFINKLNHLFDNENPFSRDKIVLVDSLKYNNELTVYQFSFDSGTFGHSIDFLVLSKDRKMISEDNSFLSSNSISSVSKLGKDSLLIKLIELDFDIDSTKINIPFKIELEKEGNYIPPSKRLNIPLN